jgi:hypothetical protein
LTHLLSVPFLYPVELQGIFRISGPLGEVRELYAQFSKDGTLDLTAAKTDPHIATGALKLYLREQSEPLIPFNLYSEFLKAQSMSVAYSNACTQVINAFSVQDFLPPMLKCKVLLLCSRRCHLLHQASSNT